MNSTEFRGTAFFLLGGLLTLALGGCLRPSQERAKRDLEVGRQQTEEVSVDVRHGLAAVQELSAERLTLWASAPTLAVDLEFASAPRSFELEIRNCMPSGELAASGEATIAPQPKGQPTRCRFLLEDLEERSTITFAIPHVSRREPFRFAVLSDIQEAIDDVQDVLQTVNAQTNVDFLLGAGDLTRQGSTTELRRFQKELLRLNVPYYTTLGNHELGHRPPPFQNLFGRGSFRFDHHGVRFTLLDAASATIDPLVYQWLDTWLEEASARPHVVAMHIPPLDPIGVRNGAFASRNEAAKLLAKLAQQNVDLTLYGHIHSYYHFENAGIAAHISGGGGAIPETFDGIDRHFLLIDVNPRTSEFDVSVIRVD